MRTASRVTSGPIPSPAPTRTFNFIGLLTSRSQLCFSQTPMVVWKQRNKVLIEDRLSAIRQFVKAVVDQIQIRTIEGEAKLLQAMREGTPAGMLSQHHAIVGHAHRSRG